MLCENTPLKYLFTVVFDDDTRLEQTSDDVSAIDSIRSAYYDVEQSDKCPKALILKSLDGSVQAAVSLQDGHFEVDGVPFFIGEAPSSEEPLELIYLRRNYRDFVVGAEGPEQISHTIHYHFGWRQGNVVRTMFLI